MCNKKEFELITSMYLSRCGRARSKIEDSIKEARINHGFENGSALTAVFEKHFEEARKGIEPLTDDNGFLLEGEDGHLVFDKKDAFKMLKAIDIINTYIL